MCAFSVSTYLRILFPQANIILTGLRENEKVERGTCTTKHYTKMNWMNSVFSTTTNDIEFRSFSLFFILDIVLQLFTKSSETVKLLQCAKQMWRAHPIRSALFEVECATIVIVNQMNTNMSMELNWSREKELIEL